MSKSSTSPSINQEIIALYDEYTHAPLARRVFIKRLTAITGSTAAATAVLPLLENNYAHAQIVKPDDARIVVETVSFDGVDSKVTAQLSYPKGASGKLPSVIVIHENRGLNPHIQDIGRRLAIAGYLVLAVDYLSPAGGTPSDEDKGREMISKLDPAQVLGNGQAAVKYLRSHARSNGKVGVVGFCWGGGQTNRLAAAGTDIQAAVAFYGPVPKAEDVPNIKAPILLHYAGLDENINKGWPGYEAALKAAGKTYQWYLYDGVNHAFNNDTNAARYNEAAAQLAWQRTLDFFAKYLA